MIHEVSKIFQLAELVYEMFSNKSLENLLLFLVRMRFLIFLITKIIMTSKTGTSAITPFSNERN